MGDEPERAPWHVRTGEYFASWGTWSAMKFNKVLKTVDRSAVSTYLHLRKFSADERLESAIEPYLLPVRLLDGSPRITALQAEENTLFVDQSGDTIRIEGSKLLIQSKLRRTIFNAAGFTIQDQGWAVLLLEQLKQVWSPL